MRGPEHLKERTGELQSWLLSAHPYASLKLSERLAVWGLLGYGLGQMSLAEGGGAIETEIALLMGAFAGRGRLVAAGSGAAGRGPSLSVSTTWGEAASGVEQLWSQGAGSAGLAENAVAAPAGRLAAELGYGMETAGAAPAYRLGGRLSLGPSFSLELEAGCRASAAAAPEHGLKLNASLRW